MFLGCNLSYWESVSSITKLQNHAETNPPSSEMIINTEWGGFNDLSVLNVTQFDRSVDEQSTQPGTQTFEKMVSGRYLGELTRVILLYLMKKKVIRKMGKQFKDRFALKSEHLCLMLQDTSEQLLEIENFLQHEFGFDSLLEERQQIRKVCDIVVKRAARLVAAGVGAVAYQTGLIYSQPKMLIN